MEKKTISIIGCGNMGEAILKGILGSSLLAPGEIGFFEKDDSRREYITMNYRIAPAGDICSSFRNSKYLLIAVKPQDIGNLIKDIRKCFDLDRNCIISILAGISTSYYEKNLGRGASVIRVMPNTPALYKKGMITLSRGKYAGDDDLSFVEGLMGKMGTCMVIDESLQHISTAINGSGPAYFFLFCKALIEASIANGLDPGTARKLVAGTMIGAGEMIQSSDVDIDELITRVASPGGTTERALKTFEDHDLEQTVKEAVTNALKRSIELEKEINLRK